MNSSGIPDFSEFVPHPPHFEHPAEGNLTLTTTLPEVMHRDNPRLDLDFLKRGLAPEFPEIECEMMSET